MDELRKAAEAAKAAWDRWRPGAAPLPSRELDDAMAALGEALRITDGWRVIPGGGHMRQGGQVGQG